MAAADIPDQSGRTVLITGANSGRDLASARELARAGAHLILTARDEAKGASAEAVDARAALHAPGRSPCSADRLT